MLHGRTVTRAREGRKGNANRYHNLSLRILHVAMTRYPMLTPPLEHVVQEQRTLLQAISAGDAETAERVATEHVTTFEKEIRRAI
jgi:DNA-binding FadR family transcriptional regulator